MDYTREQLVKLIFDLFDIDSIPRIIDRQISKYVSELGYSYKEIAQALVFWMEKENGEYQPKYGIGIIPLVMDRAKHFFEEKRKQKERQLKSLEKANQEIDIILQPQVLKKKKRIPKINMEDLEV